MVYLSWLLAVVATLGSIYFSNFMMLPPCSLCWWQRVCMYPLTIVFMIAFIRKDRDCIYYAMPLITIGFLISSYHNLLYYGAIEKSIIPCTSGVSCTSVQLVWFGFLTIPLMALIAFSLLLLITIYSAITKGEQ